MNPDLRQVELAIIRRFLDAHDVPAVTDSRTGRVAALITLLHGEAGMDHIITIDIDEAQDDLRRFVFRANPDLLNAGNISERQAGSVNAVTQNRRQQPENVSELQYASGISADNYNEDGLTTGGAKADSFSTAAVEHTLERLTQVNNRLALGCYCLTEDASQIYFTCTVIDTLEQIKPLLLTLLAMIAMQTEHYGLFFT